MAKSISMEQHKRKDLNLRLGNLILAIFLATVPTAITYGTLSIHGLNILSIQLLKILIANN